MLLKIGFSKTCCILERYFNCWQEVLSVRNIHGAGFPLMKNISTMLENSSHLLTFEKNFLDLYANIKICRDFHTYLEICGDLDTNVTTSWVPN